MFTYLVRPGPMGYCVEEGNSTVAAPNNLTEHDLVTSCEEEEGLLLEVATGDFLVTLDAMFWTF